MNILGIDYGEKHIGLALATGPLAEPLQNLKKSGATLIALNQICKRLQIQKLVIGISQGHLEEKIKYFAKQLNETTHLPVRFQDETLSSQRVQEKLIQANAKKKKRRGPDHAFAATLILQDFLDTEPKKVG